MKTQRKFGIELETTGLDAHDLERALRAGGLRAQAESYNHNARNYWKIVPDGSISPTNGGCGEVVSPPMFDVDEVRAACRSLVAGGATVNRSCGLHVHMDVSDIGDGPEGALAWKILLASYVAAEQEIDALMPASRRANMNSFCKSMVRAPSITPTAKAAVIDRIWGAARLSDMSAVYNHDRYWKVNLQAFVRQGTVEFRQHAGSVNHEKVANWILLMETLIANATRAAKAVRDGVADEGSIKTRLRDGTWYSGRSVERLMAVLAPSYPHATAQAPVASATSIAGNDWRSSLDPATFRPVRLVVRNGSGDAPRARAVEIMNANPTLPWAEMIGRIVEATGMTPGNANMIFARWNKRLRERELGAATRTAARAGAVLPAPAWTEISEFYVERAMELSGVVS